MCVTDIIKRKEITGHVILSMYLPIVYNLLCMRVHNWGLGKDLLIRMEEVHQHSSLLC